jgi:site-specific recombinase XerD
MGRPASNPGPLTSGDRVALVSLEEGLREARGQGDVRPPFAVLADYLQSLGIAPPERAVAAISLAQGRDEWLARVRSSSRSHSTLVGYRVALDQLIAFLESSGLDETPLTEQTLIAHLEDYRRRARPAAATYYRRFLLLRRFFRWYSRRAGVSDPFLELEPPAKPQQEADWLSPEEFARLLAAAGSPRRNRPGLAERDRLVLLALVTTGLRRSELLALNWADVDLEDTAPTLLVRSGKGGKPRRQPLPPALAAELARRRTALGAGAEAPVFCGLAGGRLQATVLATIIRRAAERAGLEKRVTAHTLRHTAATWLRQQTGDARLVAAYLGHADLSTVSRYAHVAPAELHDAAARIADRAELVAALSPPGHAGTLDRRHGATPASQGGERRTPGPSGSIETAEGLLHP